MMDLQKKDFESFVSTTLFCSYQVKRAPMRKAAKFFRKKWQWSEVAATKRFVSSKTGDFPAVRGPAMAKKKRKRQETGSPRPGDNLPDNPAGTPAVRADAEESADATQEDAETRSKRVFFGRSGHLAVMSEFLHRRINVAIPEVDVGDDIFVVKGVSPEVIRVQVKAATATEQQDSYVAVIDVAEEQLQVPEDEPPLVYVFAVRRLPGKEGRWHDFMVVRRGTLYARYKNERAGSRYLNPETKKPFVRFRIVLTKTTSESGPGSVSFQEYRDAWDPWPPPQLPREENVQG